MGTKPYHSDNCCSGIAVFFLRCHSFACGQVLRCEVPSRLNGCHFSVFGCCLQKIGAPQRRHFFIATHPFLKTIYKYIRLIHRLPLVYYCYPPLFVLEYSRHLAREPDDVLCAAYCGTEHNLSIPTPSEVREYVNGRKLDK